jgi:phosphate-selective porin OprO/OprP
MIKKLLLTSTILAIGSASPVLAEDGISSRLRQLEQEIAILKRQQEVKDEEAASKAAKSANIEIGKKGVKISSPDGKNSLTLRGYAQFDSRFFINDDNQSDVDTLLVRRARPIIEAQAGDFAFRLMPDFAGSTTRIMDAYAEYKPYQEFNIRAGKFKPPVSLDRLKSATDTIFVERSMPANLAPNRDLGTQIYGDVIPQLSYEFGIFNGAEDLGNNDNDVDDSKEWALRLFSHPFKQTASAFKDLGVGVAGTWGEKEGSTSVRQVGAYRTPGQASFFQYSTPTFANGEHYRLAPQAYYYYGPFGVQAEYTISSQELQNGVRKIVAENKAWETQLSYVLTGEDASFKGVTPAKPFNPSNGGWGAWEVGVRAGELEVDDAVFPNFASISTSASKATAYGAVLNGYLNDNVKVSLDYANTSFEGGAVANQDREDEQVLFTRLGYKF